MQLTPPSGNCLPDLLRSVGSGGALDLLQGGGGLPCWIQNLGPQNLSLGVPATPVPGEGPPFCVSWQVGTGPLLLPAEVHVL